MPQRRIREKPDAPGTLDFSEFYLPHEGQILVHESEAKEKYLEAARRWGKSRCAFGEFLKAYIRWWNLAAQGKRDKWLVPAFHAWIIVPTEDQGTQTWNELKEFLPPKLLLHKSENPRNFTLRGPNGLEAFVELKSAYNHDSLQTVGLDFLWVNEAQDVSDKAIEKLRPTLRSKGRLQQAIFEGIPSLYPDHWFRRGAVSKMRTKGSQRAYFRFTVYDNPMLNDADRKAVEDDREILTEASWRRMYLAEFSQNAGFFRNVDSCIEGDLLSTPIPGADYVVGIDLGMSNDFTVVIVMDAAKRQVVHHELYDSMPMPDQKERIRQVCEDWSVSRVQVDATGMQRGYAEELVTMGLPIQRDNQERPGLHITGEVRANLLSTLAVAIERSTISFPSIPQLLRQLRAFQYIRVNTAAGYSYRAMAPAGEHDDEVFALALALSICEPPVERANASHLPYFVPYIANQRPESDFLRRRRAARSQRMIEAAERAGMLL